MTQTSDPEARQREILALAPRPAVAALARRWASPERFAGLGTDAVSAWGQQGEDEPWWVMVSTDGAASRCGCGQPDRPCAHILALWLVLAARPDAVPTAEAPPDVVAWRSRRAPLARKGPDPRRAQAREARVDAGLEQLRRWMCDQARAGLASLEERPTAHWELPAARLTDAQARGLADRVRRLGALAGAGPGWPERAALELGRLALICHAWEQRTALSPGRRRDLEAVVGYTTRVEEVLAGPPVRDRWCVVGQVTEELDHPPLLSRRTWVVGERSGRSAVLLHFAPRGQPMRPAPNPGTAVEADLHPYPGHSGQRAELGAAEGHPTPLVAPPGGAPDAEALLDTLAEHTARQPWVDHHPALLLDAVPVPAPGGWQLRDRHARALPLREGEHWTLLALSAGRPLAVFGEWDGRALRPLGAFVQQRFTALEG